MSLNLTEGEFHDVWWRRTEIAEPQPARPNAQVENPGPTLSVTSVWKAKEVTLLQLFELLSFRLVRPTFVLHGALVAIGNSANHKRDRRVVSQVSNLSGRLDGVEEQFEGVAHDEANDRCLRGYRWGHRSLNAERMTTNEFQDIRLRRRHLIIRDFLTTRLWLANVGAPPRRLRRASRAG